MIHFRSQSATLEHLQNTNATMAPHTFRRQNGAPLNGEAPLCKPPFCGVLQPRRQFLGKIYGTRVIDSFLTELLLLTKLTLAILYLWSAAPQVLLLWHHKTYYGLCILPSLETRDQLPWQGDGACCCHGFSKRKSASFYKQSQRLGSNNRCSLLATSETGQSDLPVRILALVLLAKPTFADPQSAVCCSPGPPAAP
jgi:hypothetical protein